MEYLTPARRSAADGASCSTDVYEPRRAQGVCARGNEVDEEAFASAVLEHGITAESELCAIFGLKPSRVKYLKRVMALTQRAAPATASLPEFEELQAIWREVPGLTVDAAAHALGVSCSTLRRYLLWLPGLRWGRGGVPMHIPTTTSPLLSHRSTGTLLK